MKQFSKIYIMYTQKIGLNIGLIWSRPYVKCIFILRFLMRITKLEHLRYKSYVFSSFCQINARRRFGCIYWFKRKITTTTTTNLYLFEYFVIAFEISLIQFQYLLKEDTLVSFIPLFNSELTVWIHVYFFSLLEKVHFIFHFKSLKAHYHSAIPKTLYQAYGWNVKKTHFYDHGLCIRV